MVHPRRSPFAARRAVSGAAAVAALLASIVQSVLASVPEGLPGADPSAASASHLLISEVQTGGGSASDEFVELYNPTLVSQPLEGLQLVYVTASGATITAKAAWTAGAPSVSAGAHLLVANEAGIYAGIADVTYANGLAATGGSMALRQSGATTAIDAVGWGTAASTWLEGTPAPAPAAGHSLERLPGGAAGSGQDTDNNLVDFFDQTTPAPQDAASPPIPPASPTPSPSTSASPSPTPDGTATAVPTDSPIPSATPTPTATSVPTATPAPTAPPTLAPTATPSPSPTPAPTATPSPVLSIAAARSLPDGATATVEGIALTASDFTDGGGYLADDSGASAVLVSGASFARGDRLQATGVLDDRYAQRTLRVEADGLILVGAGVDPAPMAVATGAVGETVECRLVTLTGLIIGSPTELSAGLAFDVDDGTGPTRVLVATATGISTADWTSGMQLTAIGVVGQRDSTGTGASGYRVQPRDAADVISVGPPPTPEPSPTPTSSPTPSGSPSDNPSSSPSPTPSPGGGQPLITIAEARAAATGARVHVRGVVTSPSGLIEPGSAVIQDASGAILLRLGDEAGELALGELVDLEGTRSTKAGMLSIRVSLLPAHLGPGTDPTPLRMTTAAFGESQEALLIVARGAIVTTPLRSSAGTVYFSIDDGSGPLRVFLAPQLGIAASALPRGSWVEIVGVLGQETTGREPLRGYRLWPRLADDIQLLAATTSPGPSASGATGAAGNSGVGTGSGPQVSTTSSGSGSGRSDLVLPVPLLVAAQPTVGPFSVAPLPSVDAMATGTTAPSLPETSAWLLASAGLLLAAMAGGWWAWTREASPIAPDDLTPNDVTPDPYRLADEEPKPQPDTGLSSTAVALALVPEPAAERKKARRILPRT